MKMMFTCLELIIFHYNIYNHGIITITVAVNIKYLYLNNYSKYFFITTTIWTLVIQFKHFSHITTVYNNVTKLSPRKST